ncbi:hypothetical protein [Paraflavitalea pollutisoli]|uniref:hypothetical protein n=1 Tax=Paraflavitalea pollutisoli TaxID=3034143 RepID=UPI0023ECC69D|nr:hypothetical protein [Paraflavitalea sp. H1-2-19X]
MYQLRLLPTVVLSLLLSLVVLHYFVPWNGFIYAGLGTALLLLCLLMLAKEMTITTHPSFRTWAHLILFLIASISLIYWIFQLLAPARGTTNRQLSFGMDGYFEKIRSNEAALTAFFSQMPKGGDLHSHFTGAIYTETLIEEAIRQHLWINIVTFKLHSDSNSFKIRVKPEKEQKDQKKNKANSFIPDPNVLRLDTLVNKKEYSWLRQRLMLEWSVKDYYDAFSPSDKHFFDAFGKFPSMPEAKGLWELKERAKKEHVQYIELMTWSIPGKQYATREYLPEDSLLMLAMRLQDMARLDTLFTKLYVALCDSTADSARKYCRQLRRFHAGIDDSDFTMRYQANIRREKRPVEVFRDLIAVFEAASQDSLVVGVNIVNREDGPLSMRDYALHMKMFQYMHTIYPAVRYSMHAGELTMGTVKPEDLSWHISDAVYTAGARRIGHGVDIAYERDNLALLKHMRDKKIAVEINLVSNEFILKVKGQRHPVTLYADHGVPIVISTDDAGILRTNHTEQFVLLALRYPSFRYSDIRQFIVNSIEYSFIKEPALKASLLKKLEQDLDDFEDRILAAQ